MPDWVTVDNSSYWAFSKWWRLEKRVECWPTPACIADAMARMHPLRIVGLWMIKSKHMDLWSTDEANTVIAVRLHCWSSSWTLRCRRFNSAEVTVCVSRSMNFGAVVDRTYAMRRVGCLCGEDKKLSRMIFKRVAHWESSRDSINDHMSWIRIFLCPKRWRNGKDCKRNCNSAQNEEWSVLDSCLEARAS